MELYVQTKEKNMLKITRDRTGGETVASVAKSARLIVWDGDCDRPPVEYLSEYSQICGGLNGVLTFIADIKTDDGSVIKIEDKYSPDNQGLKIQRHVRVLQAGCAIGIRADLLLDMFPDEAPPFESLRYFAPPALYDKNDLDEDGFEDYFHTQKLIYRDDRFNYPQFMAYHPAKRISLSLERINLPTYDMHPQRGVNPETGELNPFFVQKTDIGSMGVWGGDGCGACLCACYPFFEGDATIGLYISKTIPFGAFWPLKDGEEMKVSYRLRCGVDESFHDACWKSVARVIRETKPEPPPLPDVPEELVRLRLESLNRYYVEKSDDEDKNRPAGYVLNCHPQNGEQLGNIIQYGFTGQNILNAYNVLRYGYQQGNSEYIRRARRITDFFADSIYIPESGMFYNLYNVDSKRVDFWWTGLLLPLAYASGEDLESLMGPLYNYRKKVIDKLKTLKGAYLRCMNEDVTALLKIYNFEKQHGVEHENWKRAVVGYCEFLLRSQCEDGGWYRAYDLDGNAITEPELWFGGTMYEKKSSTASCIPLLVDTWLETNDERFLDAAKRAGTFVKQVIIDKVRFNGGIHDSIYAKGQLIDNESILYPMLGMLALYEATGEKEFLDGAVDAAHYNASWVCLWRVPLPEDSTLGRYGFNSIGMGACDTCGAGYLHPFQLMCIAEMARIAQLSGDIELLDAAYLYWQGCNQTVATDKKSWGYAYPGLQEEGYLVSWWAVDDPMFSEATGFGDRRKGEGNKTCFPWINGVGVRAYWMLMDTFGTANFDEIRYKCLER